MQINNAADRISASLEEKRSRRPWNSDLHPRDSKGRFIETGGIARLWGGGIARVVRALGGRNVLVEDTTTHKRSTIHASRLTMVARPDGTAPTKSKRKVRDEDSRRVGDQRRGTGLDTDDVGDHGDTPDDPHDRDDEGEDIGEDEEDQDLGEGPEPEDDDLLVPRGRVFQDGEQATQNPAPGIQYDALDMPGSALARHRHGKGAALRTPGPKTDKHKFVNHEHAQEAADELITDYLDPLNDVWDDQWDDRDARDAYEQLSDALSVSLSAQYAHDDQAEQRKIAELYDLSDLAEHLSSLAEDAKKEDIAEAAATLASALELAHSRFTAHGDKPIPNPRKGHAPNNAWQPRPVKRAAAKPGRRRDPSRPFKTLDDVRSHWASGKITPFTADKDKQTRHAQATAELFEKLEKPQLSRNGNFVIAKMTTEKDGQRKTGYAVILADSGVRLTASDRKGEAVEFANRLEAGQIGGKPFDWKSPGYHSRLASPEGQEMVRRAGVEAQQAFTAKATKKRVGAAARNTPALATPETAAAQQISERTGVPAPNVAVGHIGPGEGQQTSAPAPGKPLGDERGRPRSSEELREFWKRGGDDSTPEAQRDQLRKFANDPNITLHLADHRGLVLLERKRDGRPAQFEVRAAGTARPLIGLGTRGIHSYGDFEDRDTADRFTLYLGSNLRHQDGRTVDWGGPRLNKELNEFRDKDGQSAGKAIWQIAGEFDRQRGVTDSAAARFGRSKPAQNNEQRETSPNAVEPAAANAEPEQRGKSQTVQPGGPTGPKARDYSQVAREDLDTVYEEAVRAWADGEYEDDARKAARAKAEVDAILAEAQRRDAEEHSGRLARVKLGAVNDKGDQPVAIDGDKEGMATLQGSTGHWKWNRLGRGTRYSSEKTFLTREAALADLVRERDEEHAPAPEPVPDLAEEPTGQDADMAVAAALDLASQQLIPAFNSLRTLHSGDAVVELAQRAGTVVKQHEQGELSSLDAISEFQAVLDDVQRATRGLQGRDNIYIQSLLRTARENVGVARAALADQRKKDTDSGVRGSGANVLADVPAGRGGADGQHRAGGVRAAAGTGDRGGNQRTGGRAGTADEGGNGRSGARRGAEDRPVQRQGVDSSGPGVRDGEGAGDGGEGHASRVPAAAGRVAFGSPEQEAAAPAFEPPANGEPLTPSTPLNRVKANIAAIEILHRLEAEQRPATAEEQKELARWSGWGATPQVFKPKPDEQFAPLQKKLQELLSEDEWREARANTKNAHYTDPRIVQQIWDAVGNLGFDGGDVLEPGSGSGNFIGYAPEAARMMGVELDPITARISKALYPHADVRHESFGDTRAPNGTFDLTIGNVPFGRYKVPDLIHNKGNHSVHNHFILKSLELTRPGGLVAVVTSSLTMDGHGQHAESARMEMASKGELVGAIRLPSGAHQRTAGTGVVTDLLIFRRRERDKAFTSGRTRKKEIKDLSERGPGDPPMWVHSLPRFGLPGQLDPAEDEQAVPVHYNSYFHDRPEQILGELSVGHGMNRANELRVDGDGDPIANLHNALKRTVAEANDAGLAYQAPPKDRKRVKLLPPGSPRVDGHVQAEPDGTFTQVRDGMVHPFPVSQKQADEARRLLSLRDTFQSLLAEESRKDADESLIDRMRTALNEQYEAYAEKYGAINRFEWAHTTVTDPTTGERVKKAYRKKAPRGGLFSKDPTMRNIAGLDDYDDITKTTTRAAIFGKRQGTYREIAERAEAPQDALAVVLEQQGELTPDGLARVMDTDTEHATARLLAARSIDPDTGVSYPLAFEDPSGALVPTADYLSGNVREKLEEARRAAVDDPRFEVNVEHLERVIPPDLSTGEIAAPMGASWIGQEAVQQFLRETLGSKDITVSWQGGALWAVDAPAGIKNQIAYRTRDTWSVPGYDALKLAEAILTNKKIRVTIQTREGTVFDQKGTDDANARAEQLKEAFTDWLWTDPDRAEIHKRRYNDTFNSMAPRSYDGQRRTMPGLVEWFKPHAHQHAAVSRMVNEPAVLLAHEVGAGKTAEMTMGVMELRRLGLVNKAAMVVPGHMLDQFRTEFAELYPESVANNRILTAGSDDLAGNGRREFIARAASGDYDAIIMTQTAFESIQMRPEVQERYILRQLEALEEKIRRQKEIDGEDNDTRLVKRMETQLSNRREKLTKKLNGLKDAAGLHFEDMGIDYLVVDEAHMYKNLYTPSSIDSAAIEGSNRASDLEMKLEYLREHTGSGRVVTFATATPVANSITEVHTMMRYLRPDLLQQLGIEDFDDFASAFGQMVSAIERSADGSYSEKTRLAAFQNVPELMRLWRAFADVKNSEDLDLPVPDVAGGKAVTITMPQSEAQVEYEEQIKRRAAALAGGNVDPREDNYLKLMSDGRAAALDPRLLDPDLGAGNKLPTVADNITRIYEQTKDTVYPSSKSDPTPHETPGGLQIVFLDLGTPKDPGKTKKRKKVEGEAEAPADDGAEEAVTNFSTYDELKSLLIARGVPSEKIRFIHEAKDDTAKARLFHEARTGRIAVLLGSTQKMGTGTNVQLRATALHHVDAPWRPADVEQRNGRVIRQGNANSEVAIFQYATEQSTDAKFWEAIARKARFIRQLMRGSLTERVVEDIGEIKFDADESAALIAGDPHLIAQASVRPIVKRLRSRSNAHQRSQEGFKKSIRDAEIAEETTATLVGELEDALEGRKKTRGADFNARIGKVEFTGTEGRTKARVALNTALRAVLAEGRQGRWSEDRTPEVIGQLGNLDITAVYEQRWDFNRSAYVRGVTLNIPALPGSHRLYQDHELVDTDGKPAPLPLMRLEDAIAGIETQIRRAQDMLADKKRAAEQAQSRVGKAFDMADQLDKSTQQLAILDEIMRLKARSGGDPKEREDAIKALDRELRELIGDEEDILAQVSARDVNLSPKTPAPPAVTTDEEGRTRFVWPDAEAREAAREKGRAAKRDAAAARQKERDRVAPPVVDALAMNNDELGTEAERLAGLIASDEASEEDVLRHAGLEREQQRRAKKNPYDKPYQPLTEAVEETTQAAPENSAGTSAAAPYANSVAWRRGLTYVDAAEGAVTRAADATWDREGMPGAVPLLRRALFAALNAHEDDDYEGAELGLIDARERAVGLLSTLEDSERGTMEEPLRNFLDAIDAYLPRHRATRAKWEAQDEQHRSIESQARAATENAPWRTQTGREQAGSEGGGPTAVTGQEEQPSGTGEGTVPEMSGVVAERFRALEEAGVDGSLRKDWREAEAAFAGGDTDRGALNLYIASRSAWHMGTSTVRPLPDELAANLRAFAVEAQHTALRHKPLEEGERLTSYRDLKEGDIVREAFGPNRYMVIKQDASARVNDHEVWVDGSDLGRDGGAFGFQPADFLVVQGERDSDPVQRFIATEEQRAVEKEAERREREARRAARQAEERQAEEAGAEGDLVAPDGLTVGDRITVRGRDNRGQATTVSGRLLAEPQKVTAIRNGVKTLSWRLYVGEEGDEANLRNLVTIARDEHVERHADATPSQNAAKEPAESRSADNSDEAETVAPQDLSVDDYVRAETQNSAGNSVVREGYLRAKPEPATVTVDGEERAGYKLFLGRHDGVHPQHHPVFVPDGQAVTRANNPAMVGRTESNDFGWKGAGDTRESLDASRAGAPDVEHGELHVHGTEVGRAVYVGGKRIGLILQDPIALHASGIRDWRGYLDDSGFVSHRRDRPNWVEGEFRTVDAPGLAVADLVAAYQSGTPGSGHVAPYVASDNWYAQRLLKRQRLGAMDESAPRFAPPPREMSSADSAQEISEVIRMYEEWLANAGNDPDDTYSSLLAKAKLALAEVQTSDRVEQAPGASSAADTADDETEVLDPDQVSVDDYVRAETQNTAGNSVIREGYVLADPEQVTATRNKERIKAWRLYIGRQGEKPSPRNAVTILLDEKVERLSAPESEDAQRFGGPGAPQGEAERVSASGTESETFDSVPSPRISFPQWPWQEKTDEQLDDWIKELELWLRDEAPKLPADDQTPHWARRNLEKLKRHREERKNVRVRDAEKLGGEERIRAFVDRAELEALDMSSTVGDKEGWRVKVGGEEAGRVLQFGAQWNTEDDNHLGGTGEWHDRDHAVAALVAAYDERRAEEGGESTASGDSEDENTAGSRRGENSGGESRSRGAGRGGQQSPDSGVSDTPGDDNSAPEGAAGQKEEEERGDGQRRQRRRDRDRNRPENGADKPGAAGGRPFIPHIPDNRDRDRDNDDDRSTSADLDEPRRLKALLARYRSGEAPVPSGTDPEQHAEYLRQLASNDSLTLSPGGGLVTWTNTGRTWRFGIAASGLHLEGWEADGEAIGGREGARRLAGAYEQLRDADGELIDWASPTLGEEQLGRWQSPDGTSLAGAVSRTRNVFADLRGKEAPQGEDEPGGSGQQSSAPDAEPVAGGEGAAQSFAGAADGTAERGNAAGAGPGQSESARTDETSTDPAESGSGESAASGAPSGDGWKIPPKEAWRGLEEGPGHVLNAEGERLFFTPEQRQALAAEAVVLTPVVRSDSEGQVWRNGRRIGELHGPHLHAHYQDDAVESWHSWSPFSAESPNFASREAALAHLVLRERARNADPSHVDPGLANKLDLAVQIDLPETLGGPEFNDEEVARYDALRSLLVALGNGITPSGNTADDLVQAHDELLWMATRYTPPEPTGNKRKMGGPKYVARSIEKYLDLLRPEDPRAAHHEARLNRAAQQFFNELMESGGEERATSVAVADIRKGDIVKLSGRVTTYGGATGTKTGYVVDEPKKATLTYDGKRHKAWRITLSPDPWESSRHPVDTETFIIPADREGLLLVRAEDVNIPVDEHRYELPGGEESRDGSDQNSSAAQDGNTPGASGARESGLGSDGHSAEQAADGAPRGDDSRSAQGTSAPVTSQTAGGDSNTTSASGQAAASAGELPGRQPEPSSRRERQDQPGGGRPAEGAPTAPEHVGGRPAEWVKVSDLELGDLVRLDGITRGGKPRTLAGYVADGPKEVPTVKARRVQGMYRVLISDAPDGRGKRESVWVPTDATAARATRDDSDQVDGGPLTGAESDVLTDGIAGRVPTDRSGNGLFPGSVVTDDNGREGVVTGSNASNARVQFGDDRTDDAHAPSSLNVTDGGAARPTGWTADGRLVRPGDVVGDRDGNRLGTVEDVDGDTATVATPQGMAGIPIADLRVLGGTADYTPSDAKVQRLERVPASDLREGDVVLVDNGTTGLSAARVTGKEELNAGHTRITAVDVATGEEHILNGSGSSVYTRALDTDGQAPELGPEDAPSSDGEITSYEPAPAVDPVTGPTVDPQLSPEERDAIEDRGEAPTDEPEAQQAAARVANDLPVTPGQASALADELREGADPSTAEGRAAQRAADHLDAAAGNEPDNAGRPEPGTVASVGVGDTITLANEFDPDTMTAYRVVAIQEAPGGVLLLTIEDQDGMRFKRSLAGSDPLYQLPDPQAPAADGDGEPRDPNPAADQNQIRADYGDSVVRAVIDNAIQGTTTPGSIHQLRQQIAEQLTPKALRAAMRRARDGALTAITDVGIDGAERDELVRSLRAEAARARNDAIRAAVRTLDDLEPLDGESQQDTARRAADLLRLIPEALRNRPRTGDSTDGDFRAGDAVAQHVGEALGEALQAAASGGELTEERRAAIVAQLAARMAASRDAAAQRIAANVPAGRRPGVFAHIVAALVAIARKVVALVAAFLKALAKAWRRGREGVRNLRERITRFRRGLMQRIKAWPETRRLRRLAAAADLPQRSDGLPLGDRVAHWARLLPAPGRFGQVSRRARWYRPSSRSTLAAGQLPSVQDGVRWTMDRAVDGGPGPQALRHLAVVRAAGQDLDTDVAARLTAAAPELGDDPHGTVRHAADYADNAGRRLRDLEAAAAGGAPDADLEIAAARVEAQAARQEAQRLQRAYSAALPDAVRESLAQVREMGPGTTATLVLTPDSDPGASRALADISQFVPRDWLAPTESRFLAARSGDRGMYDGASRTATVADLGDGGRRTAAHALLAHLQRNYPDLLAAQEAFHFTRTHAGRVGARRRTSLDVLLGRLFRNRLHQGSADDMVPLGLATLFSGDWYEDDDLRAFLLGLLATR
ncbi:helicase-related protein [Streptomyces sp. NPDC003016]